MASVSSLISPSPAWRGLEGGGSASTSMCLRRAPSPCPLPPGGEDALRRRIAPPSSRRVEVIVDLARRRPRDPRHLLDILERRALHRPGGAEMHEQGPLAARPDSRDV